MSSLSHPPVFVIILNWNGWRETIECLESLQQLDYPNYRLVLVDNGSEDGSLDQIRAWAKGEKRMESKFVRYCPDKKPVGVIYYDSNTALAGGDLGLEVDLQRQPSDKKLIMIHSRENLGFAGGSNLGIRYALASGAQYIWLLNNDTVVKPDSLRDLVNFLEQYPAYCGVTGQIRLYDRPDTLWNCGGWLTWYGARRYYGAGASVSSIPRDGFTPITFVTGCAVMFRASLFRKIGLLSERFFFGEEDFEFSLRLKSAHFPIACLHSAVIYHKVSKSIDTAALENLLGKIYIHYLNRFIDLRFYWPRPIWQVWRTLYCFYLFPMILLKHRIGISQLWNMVRTLLQNSACLDGVDKRTFEAALALNFIGDPRRV